MKVWGKSVLTAVLACLFLCLGTVDAEKINMSYLYFGDAQSFARQVDQTKGSLNRVSPNYFDISENGTLQITDKFNAAFIEEMRKRNIKVVPFLSNHWNREAGKKALQNREVLSREIVDFINRYQLDGVNVDIENVTELERDQYTDFVKLLREKLPSDKEVSVAVAANPDGWTKGWQGSYDYKALAQYSDYLMLMAYDESWEGLPSPGPVASISFVEDSIRYSLKSVPPDKIVLGIGFYGRIWNSDGTVLGAGISIQTIEDIVKKYNGSVIFDDQYKVPRATLTIGPNDVPATVGYRKLSPGSYTVWYENDESIKQKLRLVQKYNLKGAASWSLGLETAETWDYFNLWLNGHYFSDILGHWAQDDILAQFEKGWMTGTSSTTFSPDQTLTRAQAAAILVRAVGIAPSPAISSGFIDVPENHWAKKEIGLAKQYGMVDGVGDGKFAPEDPVTREQMAVMLTRILGYSPNEVSIDTLPFKDVSSRDWSYPAIMMMKQLNMISGYEDGTFRPKKRITRAEMAKLMNNIASKITERQNYFDRKNTPDNTNANPSP
jgi:spore germination protein YaaH